MTQKTPNASQNPKKSDDKKLSFEELLNRTGYNIPSLRRNQEVTGKIVAVTPGEILVDIGAKSEGIIAGRELVDAEEIVSQLSVGDSITATVVYPENDAGQVVLSLRKLSQDVKWSELEEKRESGEEIEVVAVEANRGGVICDLAGIRGFLPASQLVSTPANLSDLIGKTISTRVIEADRKGNRLILSQKQPDTKDITQIANLLSQISIGQQFKGTVTAVLPFGIFVELNLKVPKVPQVRKGEETSDIPATSKLEGLVHISEISWEKVEDPAKYFKVGDKVDVMVVAKDESLGRLNLSIKQLSSDPFLEVSKKYSKDQEVKGSVERITPYGVFVRLEELVEGLIHISKIPPNVEYQVGQSVDCTVEAVDDTI